MEILFIGEGERDNAAIPRLVENVLGAEIRERFRTWRDLGVHGRGLGKKLLFAILQARDEDLKGVIATIDRDKQPKRERLQNLKEARETDRSNLAHSVMPIAIGEADPHMEAWLIDDSNAVKKCLGIPATASIPNGSAKDPKAELDRLINESNRTENAKILLSELALMLNMAACQASKNSGLLEFLQDLQDEFGDAANNKNVNAS